MRALVDALSETRPKSPAAGSQVDNDEPIELAHYPDAMKPPPGAQPPIERDDFPAPPYPYTDPERRRRWSDTYKVLFSCFMCIYIYISYYLRFIYMYIYIYLTIYLNETGGTRIR